MYLDNIEQLQKKAQEIRIKTLEMCCQVGFGHITSGFSCTELLVALYYAGILHYRSKQPDWEQRDRFILSKGHSSTALYPILADVGFFNKKELESYCNETSLLGLLLKKDVPGVEISSGSLGIGLGVAAGIAKALKMDRNPAMVFCMLGDGECYEGNIWESILFAAHNNLNNLVVIVDRNYLCCTDFTENIVALEPLEQKWKSFGWSVQRINGHDFTEILSVLRGIHSMKTKGPQVIIADTVKGKGVDFISDVPLMHGAALHGDDIERARRCLLEGNIYE